MSRRRPDHFAVLSRIRPHRRVPMPPMQLPPDALIAAVTIQHIDRARADLPERTRRSLTPLVPWFCQLAAHRAGLPHMGLKRWRAALQGCEQRRLIQRVEVVDHETGEIVLAHYHHKRSGHVVPLYAVMRWVYAGVESGPTALKRTVGRSRSVKPRSRVPWWAHPLFGCPQGRPPPGTPKRLRRWSEECPYFPAREW